MLQDQGCSESFLCSWRELSPEEGPWAELPAETMRLKRDRDASEGSTYHLVLNGPSGFYEQRSVPDCGVIRPCPDLLPDALRMRHSLKITALLCA